MFTDKEFKKAIQELPSEEKDKLIIRLLRRDIDLAQKLYFELVDTDSVEDKRNIIVNEFNNYFNKIKDRNYSLDYLTGEMRFISGKISQHVKITKDKFGEVTLNILMLNTFLENNQFALLNNKLRMVYKFNIYVIIRAFKILILTNSLHEDLLLDFKNDLKQLGNNIAKYPLLMQMAIQNGLNVNWLTEAEIPKDIVAIQKEIKANGFLK